MHHLHTDKSLTFQDLKTILTDLSNGTIETYEKVDGQNIAFTTHNGRDIRIAKTKAQQANGGMLLSDIQERWKEIPNVKEAYEKAYQTLSEYLQDIPQTHRTIIFAGGYNWHTAEIIYHKTRNVFHYDLDALLIHNPNSPLLTKTYPLQRPQSPLTAIIPPIRVNLPVQNGSALESALGALKAKQDEYRLNDASTLDAYRKARLPKIKARHPSKSRWKRDRIALEPIERIINVYTYQRLNDIHSGLIPDPNNEILRVKKEITQTIQNIRAYGQYAEYEYYINSLGSTDNINSAMEGIVFDYNDRTYKLTGAYAHINQILWWNKKNTTKETKINE